MLRIRRGWPLVLLVASSFVACKKDDKPADKSADQKSVDQNSVGKSDKKDEAKGDDKKADVPGQPEQLGATPASTASADDLGYLPLQSEIVIGINFAQLQSSSVWKKFAEPQLAQGDFVAKLNEFKTKCGFDPFVAIKSMAMSLGGLGGDTKQEAVAVVHGLEKSKMVLC